MDSLPLRVMQTKYRHALYEIRLANAWDKSRPVSATNGMSVVAPEKSRCHILGDAAERGACGFDTYGGGEHVRTDEEEGSGIAEC